MKREIPDRLYKYRAFSDLTVQMLLSDKLFFADPSTFNDPLDARPVLKNDLKISELEDLLRKLIISRKKEEMEDIAGALKIKGSKTEDHIAKRSSSAAEKVIEHIRDMTTEYKKSKERIQTRWLEDHIHEELLKRYSDGVFCLAEKPDCPVMWSHYGEQHNGICLGYSVGEGIKSKVDEVDYCPGREVAACDISEMLAGNDEAKQRVDHAVRFWKAPEWKYEQEWRLIGRRGFDRNPLELEEVIFGLRCSVEVKALLVKAMKREERSPKIKFYEMKEKDSSFALEKCEVDLEELMKFPVCNHHERVSLSGDSKLESKDELTRKH